MAVIKSEKNNNSDKSKNFMSEFLQPPLLSDDANLPLISVIIPTFNCAEKIEQTLRSIERQKYKALEVIIVDAGSTDHTLEIVHSFRALISRIYTVTDYELFEMMNRGLGLISGLYVTFLIPGNHYISDYFYSFIVSEIRKHQEPDLIYCGSIQRNRKRDSLMVNYPFEEKFLSKGISPTNLPGCFFKTELFDTIGKFDTHLSSRGPLEIFCRLVKRPQSLIIHLDRVFVDVDYGPLTVANPLKIIADTFYILHRHFGLCRAIQWFLGIDHLIMVKTLWKRFKQKVFGSITH